MFPYMFMVNTYQGLELWPNSGNSEPQNHGLGKYKSQNVRIFHTSRMLCELLYVLSVSISHAFKCLPAISAGTTGKTLTCELSMLTFTFWNFGLSLVHFHKYGSLRAPGYLLYTNNFSVSIFPASQAHVFTRLPLDSHAGVCD